MGSERRKACVVAVRRAEGPSQPGAVGTETVVGGQRIDTDQDHLVKPFIGLLESLDSLVRGAAGDRPMSEERACIEATLRALYRFFRSLLPSASDEAVEGLAYSVSLLLIGEAIEANQVVADGPQPVLARSKP